MPQSQIIVTSRYLKSGTQKSKNKRRNYTKYIATRETVEVRDQNTIDRNDNATKNQQELLRDLLSDFPEAKKYLEYEDYIWFCQYHLTHFIRTRIMQRERYDHSRAFFELPEAAHRWRCRFFCWPSNSYNISRS